MEALKVLILVLILVLIVVLVLVLVQEQAVVQEYMESVRDLHVRVLLHGYVHAHVPEDADAGADARFPAEVH